MEPPETIPTSNCETFDRYMYYFCGSRSKVKNLKNTSEKEEKILWQKILFHDCLRSRIDCLGTSSERVFWRDSLVGQNSRIIICMSGVQIPLPLKNSENFNFDKGKDSWWRRIEWKVEISKEWTGCIFCDEKVLDGCLGKEEIGRETWRNAMGKNETFCDP